MPYVGTPHNLQHEYFAVMTHRSRLVLTRGEAATARAVVRFGRCLRTKVPMGPPAEVLPGWGRCGESLKSSPSPVIHMTESAERVCGVLSHEQDGRVEPIMVFLAATGLGLNAAKSFGLIETEADRLLRATRGDTRSILEKDFMAGVSALELARAASTAATQTKALTDAAHFFLQAESQPRLFHHHRGFAAAVCAVIASRDGDEGAARHWAGRAVDHYDLALRGIYRRAEGAARATGGIPGARVHWSSKSSMPGGAALGAGAATGGLGAGVAVSLGAAAIVTIAPVLLLPMAPSLARQGMGRVAVRRATKAAHEVPGDGLVSALNDQAPAVHALATRFGVATEGKAYHLDIERRRGSHLVVKAVLIVVARPK